MSLVVSIVMPVHNGGQFVEEAICSVLAQTYKEFELIVVDDGSTDDTRKVVEGLANRDSRIRVIVRNNASGSPAVPRNLGLDVARGKYVAFLDSDDIWYPTKLEKQVEFMLEKKAVVSYAAYRRIRRDGRCLQRVQVPEILSYRELLMNSAIAMSSAMVDRGTIGDKRFVQQGHEDYEFWLRIVKKHGRCFGLNEELLRYRVVEGSVSSGKLTAVLWTWRIYRQNEGLSVLHAIWCLANYGFRAAVKRLG